MPPLVHLLLALAALFATVVTMPPLLPPQENCTVKIFGNDYWPPIPYELPPIHVPPPGDRLEIDDQCPFGERIGERVVACNNDPDGEAPLVFENPDGQLTYVDVLCTDGCSDGVTVTVTEYCPYIMGPKPRHP